MNAMCMRDLPPDSTAPGTGPPQPASAGSRATAPAGTAIVGLLHELGILARDVVVTPCADGWCLRLRCPVDECVRDFLLELSADAVAAAEQGVALRRALALELDESLAECERHTRPLRITQ